MILVSALQAAKYLNIEAKTLANSRSTGIGVCIPFVKVGGKINYKQEDLDAYIEENTYKNPDNNNKRRIQKHPISCGIYLSILMINNNRKTVFFGECFTHTSEPLQIQSNKTMLETNGGVFIPNSEIIDRQDDGVIIKLATQEMIALNLIKGASDKSGTNALKAIQMILIILMAKCLILS